ncbi:MAG: hypothetical protein MUC99_10075, partial [Anaerolineae bacterium]|nr:hypothetical protein [Anaerolineae bacterium]
MAVIAKLPPKGRTQAQRARAEALAGYLFMAPAMAIFLVFLIIPIFFALVISLTDWNGITPLGQTPASATGALTLENLTDAPVTVPAGTVFSNG